MLANHYYYIQYNRACATYTLRSSATPWERQIKSNQNHTPAIQQESRQQPAKSNRELAVVIIAHRGPLLIGPLFCGPLAQGSPWSGPSQPALLASLAFQLPPLPPRLALLLG